MIKLLEMLYMSNYEKIASIIENMDKDKITIDCEIVDLNNKIKEK